MNTLQAHKLLEDALDINNSHNTEASRAILLELLEVYNKLALAHVGVYRPFKNISDNLEHVWIVPADRAEEPMSSLLSDKLEPHMGIS